MLLVEPIDYARPSVRHDGRLLAVGTDRGVVLWDLARGTELAFLPIGNAWHADVRAVGRLDHQRGDRRACGGRSSSTAAAAEFRIGPPRRLPLAGESRRDRPRTDRAGSWPWPTITMPMSRPRSGRSSVGPLDDCRAVAVSPDGQWLATGSHVPGTAPRSGASPMATKWPTCPSRAGHRGRLQPRWEVADDGRSTAAGSGKSAPGARSGRSADVGGCFSPDGRLMVVVDASRVIRLVETETGRTLARLESPDLCDVAWVDLQPRRVAPGGDHQRRLRPCTSGTCGPSASTSPAWASTGTAPAYSEDDPAGPSAPPLPPLQVDFGPLTGHLEHFTEPPEVLVQRYTARLKNDPNDADAYHHRAHALANLSRFPEAIDDLTRAIRLRPDDAHFRAIRGAIYAILKQYDPAIADLEAALAQKPDQDLVRERLAERLQ